METVIGYFINFVADFWFKTCHLLGETFFLSNSSIKLFYSVYKLMQYYKINAESLLFALKNRHFLIFKSKNKVFRPRKGE